MARKRWIAAVLLLALAIPACYSPHRASARESRPKLVVLVVFDQMRADYLTRWAEQFGDGGFRRITRGGTSFSNCHYPYANTMTGPGHATMATGRTPNEHGIISNEWYDRAAGKKINCSTNDRRQGSPERLLAPTFADALKSASDNRGKVVALSHKDRSACLVGGKHPDACYWFDCKTGSFATATHYRDRGHDWVAGFNSKKPALNLLAQTWNRYRPELDYDRLAGPDEVSAERPGIHRRQGRVFPHEFPRLSGDPGEKEFEELLCSPFGNELLLDLAKAAIPAMRLGRDDSVDFLSLSFSCNDLVGHCFGPDSQEVFDMTLRSDDLLARLLEYLDQEIGDGNYVLALCADHGVCPLPEIAAGKHPRARRVDGETIRDVAERFLNGRHGTNAEASRWIEDFSFPWIYLNHRKLSANKLKPVDVAASLAAYLRQQDCMEGAFTRTELDHADAADPAMIGKMRRSYHPDRSGDVGLILKPYHLFIDKPEGTTHGSPHEYDTHVPLIFYGRGIAARQISEPVAPGLVAAILSQAAGISMQLPAETGMATTVIAAPKPD